MDYKITKINTNEKAVGMPIAVSLDEIVERMRSDKDLQAVEELAARVQLLRMDPRPSTYGEVRGASKLPYLIFSALFGRQGTGDLRQPTGLMLLSIDTKGDQQRMMEIRQRVEQLPQTLMAFTGSSRRTLKVVVSCHRAEGDLPSDENNYIEFLRQAQEQAAKYYSAFCDYEIALQEEGLTRGCRLSQDVNTYYNKDAQPLTIIQLRQEAVKDYPQARTDEMGWTSSGLSWDDIERERRDYYVCLGRAFDEVAPKPDDPLSQERLVMRLAELCCRSGLPEESSVMRTESFPTWHLNTEQLRQMFRTVYQSMTPGEPMSQMTEKQRIAYKVKAFFERRYELRYNEMKRIEEFREKNGKLWPWRPLTKRELNRIAHEEMMDAGAAWSIDIELYVQSSMVKNYNPIHEFLNGCGDWKDKSHDYIGELARRVPNGFPQWERYFHRWFLGMVAQWQGRSRDFGNSVVPMLVGRQGTHKSTFCKLLLPLSMREYYIDDIKLDNAEQVERMLGRMALVNIDEYNAKTDREQAKIKRILTEKDVQVRRMRSDQYEMTRRMASFIATTNERQPLNDIQGSRRYLCVEVTGMIDTESRINYQQLYAQAVWELAHDERYWFNREEEAEIEAHNMDFQSMSSAEVLLTTYYEPAERNKKYFLKAADILADIAEELKKRRLTKELPNMSQLTKALKRAGFPYGAVRGVTGWYGKKRCP